MNFYVATKFRFTKCFTQRKNFDRKQVTVTLLALEKKCVRYREVSAMERQISIANLKLILKNGVRYREVSSIKHIRYREGPLCVRA